MHPYIYIVLNLINMYLYMQLLILSENDVTIPQNYIHTYAYTFIIHISDCSSGFTTFYTPTTIKVYNEKSIRI